MAWESIQERGQLIVDFFYALFIALANNVDTIGVMVAYSLKGIKVPFIINSWIAFIAFVISSGAARSGTIVASLLPGKFASYISMVLLVLIGLWLIGEPYFTKNRKPTTKTINMLDILADPIEADLDNSKHIDFKEATVLGMALSLNNIGGGLSAGILGVNWFLIGLLSAILSFIVFWAGNQVATFLERWHLGKKAPVFAGLLLIVIGIRQLL